MIMLQYSRNVSQTRWIIDDERMGEASVEVLTNAFPFISFPSLGFVLVMFFLQNSMTSILVRRI